MNEFKEVLKIYVCGVGVALAIGSTIAAAFLPFVFLIWLFVG